MSINSNIISPSQWDIWIKSTWGIWRIRGRSFTCWGVHSLAVTANKVNPNPRARQLDSSANLPHPHYLFLLGTLQSPGWLRCSLCQNSLSFMVLLEKGTTISRTRCLTICPRSKLLHLHATLPKQEWQSCLWAPRGMGYLSNLSSPGH